MLWSLAICWCCCCLLNVIWFQKLHADNFGCILSFYRFIFRQNPHLYFQIVVFLSVIASFCKNSIIQQLYFLQFIVLLLFAMFCLKRFFISVVLFFFWFYSFWFGISSSVFAFFCLDFQPSIWIIDFSIVKLYVLLASNWHLLQFIVLFCCHVLS